ncbi:MAG: hypothetical protein Q4G43_00150 [Mobilicoccus sp.]|nr:hypothetical protein [Mobilicoccus sp.]
MTLHPTPARPRWPALLFVLVAGVAAWYEAGPGSREVGMIWVVPALVLAAVVHRRGSRALPALGAGVSTTVGLLAAGQPPGLALWVAAVTVVVGVGSEAWWRWLRARMGLDGLNPRDVLVALATSGPSAILLIVAGGIPGVSPLDVPGALQVASGLVVVTLALLPVLVPGRRHVRPRLRSLLVLLPILLACAVLPSLEPDADLSWVVLVPALWGGLALNAAWGGIATLLQVSLVTLFREAWAAGPPTPWQAATDTLLLAAAASLLFVLVLYREHNAALHEGLRAGMRAHARERALLDDVIRSMNDGLVLVRDGAVVFANPAARLLMGALPAGARFADRLRERYRDTDGNALGAAELTVLDHPRPEPETLRVSARSAHGTTSHLEVTVRIMEPDLGLVTLVDSTALHARRHELTTFAGRVAADLSSPLSRVRRWIDVANVRLTQGLLAAGDEALVRADVAGDHMRGLIDDYLAHTVAREGTLRPVPTDLAEALADIADQAHDPSLTLDADLTHTVQADPQLLRRLLAGLVAEAGQYRAEDEPLTVHLTSTDAENGWVSVHVHADAGAAWAEEDSSIFGREDEDSGRGAHLRYELCQSIVDRHGGVLETLHGQGAARYRFTLPSAGHEDDHAAAPTGTDRPVATAAAR